MSSSLPDPNGTKINAAKPGPRLAPTTKRKVLVVEDHDDSREMLRVLLEMRDCSVTEARDGLEAVEMALLVHPDVILIDGSLPHVDALEATRRIRKNKLLGEVLILAMNGSGSPTYHDDALAAGCNDCFAKPIDFDRLEKLVVSIFPQSR
jgi:CheY-like chemotaxis protein